ncbi:hypothetical protein [Vibrio taketomensis]|uniref:hypothetical protein n=1 Tax=Vibrio taketomensis TaxID=2572923 RepID=UPI001E3C32C0|nr:hypothetical protein [Vibrio taketomensis]
MGFNPNHFIKLYARPRRHNLSGINQVAKLHVYGGLLLLPISLLFIYKALKRRTIADMYPWLSGNFSQIKADIQTLRQFTLPKTHPAGLAATVEGLGLRLLLALVTGTLWYIVAHPA